MLRLLGSNPVAVLATLILMSYTKLYRILYRHFLTQNWNILMKIAMCGHMMEALDTLMEDTLSLHHFLY